MPAVGGAAAASSSSRAKTRLSRHGRTATKSLSAVEAQVRALSSRDLSNGDESRNLESHDSHALYHNRGLWQKIARHAIFENLTMLVILCNAFYIAVDTDWNGAPTLLEAQAVFQLAEHGFCLYFSFEWTVKFMAFKRKLSALKDKWFCFDTLLVLMMVMENWVMTVVMASMGGGSGSTAGLGSGSILKLFRLLRLMRMARVTRMIPEMMIVINAMVAGLRSVMVVMFLLLAVLFMFSIAFTQLTVGTEMHDLHFASVGDSVYSLLIYGVFLDSLEYMCKTLEKESFICLVMFFVFVMLSALTVMNMLIGVLCGVVSEVSQEENQEIRQNSTSEKLYAVLTRLDRDNSMTISYEEFIHILEEPEVAQSLLDVKVDPIGLVDFADYIFPPRLSLEGYGTTRDPLSFEDFMEIVLNLRGTNHATVKDIVDLRKQVRNALEQLQNDICQQLHRTEALQDDSEVEQLSQQVGHLEASVGELRRELLRLGERLPAPPHPPPQPLVLDRNSVEDALSSNGAASSSGSSRGVTGGQTPTVYPNFSDISGGTTILCTGSTWHPVMKQSNKELLLCSDHQSQLWTSSTRTEVPRTSSESRCSMQQEEGVEVTSDDCMEILPNVPTRVTSPATSASGRRTPVEQDRRHRGRDTVRTDTSVASLY